MNVTINGIKYTPEPDHTPAPTLGVLLLRARRGNFS